MSTSPQIPRSAKDYKVALIFAMGFEMSAFRYMLDEEHEMTFDKQPTDQNHYILGKTGRHNVVLAWLPGEQGKGAAAIAAKDLAQTFQEVEWRLLVGIGGGVPSTRHDIRLGDVVVSMPYREHGGVVQYDLGRATPGKYQLKGFLRPPPAYLRNVIGEMESNHLGQGNMIERFISALHSRGQRIQRQYQRPPPESDVLFQGNVPHNAESTSGLCEGCDASRIVSRPPRDADEMTEIHYGLIASGDTVIASTAARQQIIADLGAPDVLCFEMEAAGVMSGYECLVIRGISDYADSHKCKHWRYYAAAAAAACAKELLMLAKPTATTAATQLSTSTQGSGQGSGGAGGDRRQIQDGTYSVNQGVLTTGGSTANIGSLNWNESRLAKEREFQDRYR